MDLSQTRTDQAALPLAPRGGSSLGGAPVCSRGRRQRQCSYHKLMPRWSWVWNWCSWRQTACHKDRGNKEAAPYLSLVWELTFEVTLLLSSLRAGIAHTPPLLTCFSATQITLKFEDLNWMSVPSLYFSTVNSQYSLVTPGHWCLPEGSACMLWGHFHSMTGVYMQLYKLHLRYARLNFFSSGKLTYKVLVSLISWQRDDNIILY